MLAEKLELKTQTNDLVWKTINVSTVWLLIDQITSTFEMNSVF
jgi:hypothetical protein